jgi:hypothetical protein
MRANALAVAGVGVLIATLLLAGAASIVVEVRGQGREQHTAHSRRP